MADDSSQVAQDFSIEHLPEWTNVRDLLAAIEEQLGSQVRDQIEEALDRDEDEVINVRGLLADIQDELGGSYFDSILQDDQGESGLTSQEDSRGWWNARNWEPCLQNTWVTQANVSSEEGPNSASDVLFGYCWSVVVFKHKLGSQLLEFHSTLLFKLLWTQLEHWYWYIYVVQGGPEL